VRHPYPKPQEVGGQLIRDVIGLLRSQGVRLPLAPINSDILIAISGGLDSIALAHLIIKYGRRVGHLDRIRLLHINHGWRAERSDEDAAFVKAFARRLGVPITVKKLKKLPKSGESWEDAARQARKQIFAKEAEKRGAFILTAHQADDLDETLLLRIFTGTAKTHGGGIFVQHGCEVRPLLKVRKHDLAAYLKEEGESWREDSTNFEGRFMRSKMRLGLMPVVEQIFPRAVEHLVDLALSAQSQPSPSDERGITGGEVLLAASGVRARRAQWEILNRSLARGRGEVHLPGGWRLKHEDSDRWVLEKI
jgi:tRNA(Ile)-lysidine synthetase-like protein